MGNVNTDRDAEYLSEDQARNASQNLNTLARRVNDGDRVIVKYKKHFDGKSVYLRGTIIVDYGLVLVLDNNDPEVDYYYDNTDCSILLRDADRVYVNVEVRAMWLEPTMPYIGKVVGPLTEDEMDEWRSKRYDN